MLYAKALEYANLSGTEIVVDADCDTHTISLYLARCAKKAIGIKINKEDILDARKNAPLNKINNVDFIAAPAEKPFQSFMPKGSDPR